MEPEDCPPPRPGTLLGAIPHRAFRFGVHRRVVEVNGPAEDLAGRPLAGAYAAALVSIFHIRRPDGATAVLSGLPAIRSLAGEVVQDAPYTIAAADGRSVQICISACPVREGDTVVGAVSIWYGAPVHGTGPAGEGPTVPTE